jgi:hypothetical protein
MSARRKYEVQIDWKHSRFGPQHVRVTAEGTSIRRAISNALLAFFSDTDPGPKARRDAHTALVIHAARLKETAAPHTKADR